MNDFDSRSEQGDALRLRCVRQIIDADDETLTIVSAVLNRVQSNPQQPVRRPRRRNAARDAEAGAK
jgi:hypothetical protein